MLSCQRDEFYLPEDVHYLNCAYMSPLARRVEQAGIEGIRSKRDPSKIFPDDFFNTSESIRQEFAHLIGAEKAHQISLAPAVSYGIASVAKNLDTSSGDEIVVLFEQFPSHVYTWQRLAADRGLTLRFISPPSDGRERGRRWNERILEAISSRTTAVCLPTVHWTDGTRFDLEAISRRSHEVEAALIVDATQSLGAAPLDVKKINPDCLVSAGYKWLMGPYSVAMVYWSERYNNGVPLEENWISRSGSENFAGLVDYCDEYQTGAVRFDVGERSNFILMPMMAEALRFIRELQPARIQEYCRHLTSDALKAIVDLGFRIEDEPFRSDHLFGIRVPDQIPLERLKQAFSERGVSVSVRGSAIRVAPNVYNDSRDVGRLLETLRACVSESVQ